MRGVVEKGEGEGRGRERVGLLPSQRMHVPTHGPDPLHSCVDPCCKCVPEFGGSRAPRVIDWSMPLSLLCLQVVVVYLGTGDKRGTFAGLYALEEVRH